MIGLVPVTAIQSLWGGGGGGRMPMAKSHIWIGSFPSEQAVEGYFEEVYDENDEDREHTPLNKFAADQGERSYDHDWVEHGYSRAGNLRELIKGHSYSENYIDQVIQVATTRGITTGNTFILADEAEIASPRSVDHADYRLWYLGIFRCNV